MKCNRCGTPHMTEHREKGVELDSCPHCGGVFLDVGELQKYVNSVLEQAGSHRRLRVPTRDQFPFYAHHGSHGSHGPSHKPHHKDNFFEEIFEGGEGEYEEPEYESGSEYEEED